MNRPVGQPDGYPIMPYFTKAVRPHQAQLGRRQLAPVRPVVEGVVADDVDHPVVPERPPQVVQVSAEQARTPPLALFAPGLHQPPGPPMQAPGQYSLLEWERLRASETRAARTHQHSS